MKKSLLRNISFGLAALIVVILMVATILEKMYGTTFVTEKIYTSWWMVILWGMYKYLALYEEIKYNKRI